MKTCGNIINIGKKSLCEMMKIDNLVLIDLRDKNQYLTKHLANAINIPYEGKMYQRDIIKVLEKSTPHNEKIVLYCERGSLSINCAKELAKKGYTVYNLVGGITNYSY